LGFTTVLYNTTYDCYFYFLACNQTYIVYGRCINAISIIPIIQNVQERVNSPLYEATKMFLVEQQLDDGRAVIVVFSRDKNGTKKIKKIRNFMPYFYVDVNVNVPITNKIIKIISGYKNIFNNPVKKIIVKSPNDIKELRDKFEVTYESDVLYTHRYIIDTYDEIPIYPLHMLAIDIEVASPENKFPDIVSAEQPIVSIACADTRGNKKVFFLVDNHMITKPKNTDIVSVYTSEEKLLNNFINWVRQLDPDIITHWNGDGFDMPYLEHRMNRLGLDANRLSPLGMFRTDLDRLTVTLKGRINLDMEKSYKHFRRITNQGQASSYTLENVAQDVLGMGKIPHDSNFYELWLNTPDKMIEYNLRDVELVLKINEKLDIINFFNYIRARSYAQLEDIFYTSRLVDNSLLHMCRGKVVLPSKNKDRNAKVPGAYVFPPTPGIHKNVITLDLKSLYPSIIKTFNISLETFDPNGEIKLKDGIGYTKKTEGIVPQMLRQLQDDREKFKKLMHGAKSADERQLYNYKQYAVKVLMNCFSADTNIVTTTGVKNIKDVKVGDTVPSINPETNVIEKKKVVRTFKYKYSGNMIHFKNSSVDLLVTPEHKMLLKHKHHNEFTLAKDCLGKNIKIPTGVSEENNNEQEITVYKTQINVEPNNSDYVYCIEVEDNHTVMAGRGTCFVWTGQSIYGYLLFPGGRMYDRDIGGSIPAWGQEIIKFTADYLKNKGYKVVAGDTDSVMFQAKSDDLLSILKEGTKLSKEITNAYKTFVKKYGADKSELIIEFEKVFEKVIYVCQKNDTTKGAKKNYAYKILWEDGQLGDGTIKVKGMSSRRSDTPKLARDVQKNVIKMILNGSTKDEIVEYLRSIDKKIQTGEIPVEDIAFPKGITKELSEYGKATNNSKTGRSYTSGVPPVIRGAMYANKYLNQHFSKGSKPKWVYIKRTPPNYPHTDVLTFQDEFPQGFVVDLDKMRDKLFKDKLEPLFLSAGFGPLPSINTSITTLNKFI